MLQLELQSFSRRLRSVFFFENKISYHAVDEVIGRQANIEVASQAKLDC